MEFLVVMLAVSCLPFISTFSINNLNFEEEMPSVNEVQMVFSCEAQKVFSDALGFCVPPEENVCENDPLDESQNAILDYDIENLHWRKMSL
ncbi:uncharacterized protein LOC143228155 isoform X2 [Tachypleus tridentatus]|uniref:uncharacterized protein LOC143228155 isoform X2 n=1 Tax=Tachypleus tridentatus TaxID=6853 RepID=UPI003FD2C3E3